MGDFRGLDMWHKARLLARSAYRLTRRLPAEERYGLTSQIRRSAVSIMANLAEGCGRGRDRELIRFISLALGSAAELQCHLILCQDLGYLTPEEAAPVEAEIGRIRRMMAVLATRLREHPRHPPTNDRRPPTADR